MLYDYKCSSCNHEFTLSSGMSEYKVPCESPCPECNEVGTVHIHHKPTGAPTGRKGNGGLERQFKNMDGDWKDIMKSIKKGNPGSTIRDY